ncbi:hypothetical protein [Mesorhizobium salmacidum]|uniref:Glycosyltransferase family 1 protein n=1 Tax=Mesorhizobium salmacidum TaxID=3015171 RepID=A0ABU8L7V4_9HYPH
MKFYELLIFDDVLPSSLSPFRTTEYRHFMNSFSSALISLEGWGNWIKGSGFSDELASLQFEPAMKSRIFRFQERRDITATIAYVTFLNNAYALLPYFEERGLPFIFQLYPGGGFELDQEETDAKLKAILLSSLCKKVITTQSITRSYIRSDRICCKDDKIVHIFGGVFNSNIQFDFSSDKLTFPDHKQTIDLCFVAHKYGGDLRSKGYDYFVGLARILAPHLPELRFHVVGEYDAGDIPLEDIGDRVVFYGRQPTEFFRWFYPRMDGIVSFNRPFVLTPGAFDGFPTGACLEAGFQGVANFINDPLGLNPEFEDGVDILLIGEDLQASAERILTVLRDKDRLASLGLGAYRAFRRVVDIDRQLATRQEVIASELLKLKGA